MNSETLRQAAVPSLLVLPLIMEEWLSSSRNPTVICDGQQRVLWHSADLPEFLEDLTSLKLERDHIAVADKRAQEALTRFFHTPDLPTAVVAIEADHHSRRHILHCRRLRVTTDVVAFGLRIFSDDDYREDSVLHFDEYFGLTRQETVICQELLRGNTVNEMVTASKRSSDTIRFHIRNIYQKVDVTSREALLAKLRLFIFD